MTRNIARPRLISTRLVLVFAADFGGLTSFYLLLAVVAQYAAASGAGAAGAGFATAVLMLSTVAAEFAIPRLVRGLGHGWVLSGGLVLLGAPALALPWAHHLAVIMAVCVLRGFGLAVIFVVCGGLSAALVPAERRGEGLGVFGIVAGLPAVIGIPLGLWLASVAGYPLVFVVGGLTALAGLVAVPGITRGRPLAATRHSTMERPLGLVAGLRTPALLRPGLLFAATAMAAGIVSTFLPSALPAHLGRLAAIALLVLAATSTATRWWAGRFGDRHDPARLLVPGVLAAALGVGTLTLIGSPVAVMAGVVLFGAGFGVVQNASLAVMYRHVPRSGFATVTALWSIAYDGGWGLGTAGFGVLAARSGYPAGFAVTGAVVLIAVAAGARRRRTVHIGSMPVTQTV